MNRREPSCSIDTAAMPSSDPAASTPGDSPVWISTSNGPEMCSWSNGCTSNDALFAWPLMSPAIPIPIPILPIAMPVMRTAGLIMGHDGFENFDCEGPGHGESPNQCITTPIHNPKFRRNAQSRGAGLIRKRRGRARPLADGIEVVARLHEPGPADAQHRFQRQPVRGGLRPDAARRAEAHIGERTAQGLERRNATGRLGRENLNWSSPRSSPRMMSAGSRDSGR